MKTGICPFSQEWNLAFHVSSVHFPPYMLFPALKSNQHLKVSNQVRFRAFLFPGTPSFPESTSHSALSHARLSPPSPGSNKSRLLIAILNPADFNLPHVIQTDFCPTRALGVSGFRFRLWPLTGWSLWRPTLSFSLCCSLAAFHTL